VPSDAEISPGFGKKPQKMSKNFTVILALFCELDGRIAFML